MMNIHLNRRVMMSRIGNYVLDLEQRKLFYAYCVSCDEEVDIDELNEIELCEQCQQEMQDN